MSDYNPEPSWFAYLGYLLVAGALLTGVVWYKRWEYRECLAVGHDPAFCQVQAACGGRR